VKADKTPGKRRQNSNHFRNWLRYTATAIGPPQQVLGDFLGRSLRVWRLGSDTGISDDTAGGRSSSRPFKSALFLRLNWGERRTRNASPETPRQCHQLTETALGVVNSLMSGPRESGMAASSTAGTEMSS
jgi:hypothetical protein